MIIYIYELDSLEEQGLQGMIAGKMNTLRSQLLDQGLVS